MGLPTESPFAGRYDGPPSEKGFLHFEKGFLHFA